MPAALALPRMTACLCSTLDFRGQPALRLSPARRRCRHGGAARRAAAFVDHGRRRRAALPEPRRGVRRTQRAIRGGVPICCPQFNQRGMLPKHGFMRNLPWALAEAKRRRAWCWRCDDSDATRAIWPHAFRGAARTRRWRRAACASRCALDNTGDAPWSFAAALHTYLRVDDIAAARLEGLQGAARWDAVRDVRQRRSRSAALRFDDEFDSVYAAPAQPLRLVQPSGTLEIAQSESCTETVVWNPGAALAPSWPTCPTTAIATCCAWRRRASTSRCSSRPAPRGRAGNNSPSL